MKITSVVGGQWGDEGKGKIVDVLSENAQIVARYQGGANAGHTVYFGNKKIILHQIPSGILRNDCICILGNGMVIDPQDLKKEIDCVESYGIKIGNRLILAENAHIVTPIHKAIDKYREARVENPIGTTCKGIGPTYVDKYNRIGLRGYELNDKIGFKKKLLARLELAIYHREIPEDTKDDLLLEISKFMGIVDVISKFVGNIYPLINQNKKSDMHILIEGAQGTLLDIDHGTYPYVTSSNPTTAGITQGLGLPVQKIDHHVGIFKAYCTRVGEGPFTTEQDNEIGEKLRKIGCEYGATTGRARRCGWFDLPATKFSAQINGLTEIALTKLDILDSFRKIPICTAYKINGEIFSEFSSVMHCLDKIEPVFTILDGWESTTSSCRKFSKLPKKAKDYINFIEEKVGVKINMVSTGPNREQTLFSSFSQ